MDYIITKKKYVIIKIKRKIIIKLRKIIISVTPFNHKFNDAFGVKRWKNDWTFPENSEEFRIT